MTHLHFSHAAQLPNTTVAFEKSRDAVLLHTYLMEVQAIWVVTHNALQEGIAVLGGAKAGFHLLACTTKLSSATCM